MDIATISAMVRDAARNVPFGNSVFQVQHLMAAADEPPERRARALLLNMAQKLQALKICHYRRRRLEIDIEELRGTIQAAEGHARRHLEIDLEEKLDGLADEEKLIEDALIELQAMHQEFARLPPLRSRAQFEAAERDYWTGRLLRDAGREMIAGGTVSIGTIGALEQIGIMVGRDPNGALIFNKAPALATGDAPKAIEAEQ